MAKYSELSGIAHNIAHHAGSGLSFISPHLAHALRAKGIGTTEIDLLAASPYPPGGADLKPLRTALLSLQSTVRALLQKHGFELDSVDSITLYATPAPWDKEGYLLHTRAVVVGGNGRAYDSGWLYE